MPLHPWTDEHDDLLRRSRPPTPPVTDAELAALRAMVESRAGVGSGTGPDDGGSQRLPR